MKAGNPKILGIAILAALLAGCSSQARKDSCAGKLEPINAVTPKGSTGPQTLPPAPNATRWEAR